MVALDELYWRRYIRARIQLNKRVKSQKNFLKIYYLKQKVLKFVLKIPKKNEYFNMHPREYFEVGIVYILLEIHCFHHRKNFTS